MRRYDTNWRDARLGELHANWGFDFPTAGTALPMVEYDRGVPLALISYQSRAWSLPTGDDVTRAYHALGQLRTAEGRFLPFITAQYDPRNWAFRLFGHNPAAHEFLNTRGWVTVTEQQFVDHLYRLRMRHTPPLAAFGVRFNTDGWILSEPSPDWPRESWPGALASNRRRNHEPLQQTRMNWRNPCTDIDFAVVDGDDRVALVVDYKAPGSRVGLDSMNLRALSSLHTRYGSEHSAASSSPVPAVVVRYQLGDTPGGGRFDVYCANPAASKLLAYVLTPMGDVDAAARVIAGEEWTELNEDQWTAVLRCSRDF